MYRTAACVSLFLMGLVMVLLALAIHQHAQQPRTIVCEANSQRLISDEHEYPAWELECDAPNVRVVMVD